jgi:hypothetical protein
VADLAPCAGAFRRVDPGAAAALGAFNFAADGLEVFTGVTEFGPGFWRTGALAVGMLCAAYSSAKAPASPI